MARPSAKPWLVVPENGTNICATGGHVCRNGAGGGRSNSSGPPLAAKAAAHALSAMGAGTVYL